MADLFISYADEDREWAERLAKALEDNGWSVWWDRRLLAGQSFDQIIERELTNTKAAVVLWSRRCRAGGSATRRGRPTPATRSLPRGSTTPSCHSNSAIGRLRALSAGREKPDIRGSSFLRQSLTAALASEPQAAAAPAAPAIQTRSEPMPPSPPPSEPARRGAWIAAAVVVLALLGAGAWFALAPQPTPPHPAESPARPPPPQPAAGAGTATTAGQSSSTTSSTTTSPASTTPPAKPLVVYTQIGAEADRGKYKALKTSLPADHYAVQAVEVMKDLIPHNDVRYCNPLNEPDAKALAALMSSKGFNAPTVTKIGKCDPTATLGNLEVWLQTGQ